MNSESVSSTGGGLYPIPLRPLTPPPVPPAWRLWLGATLVRFHFTRHLGRRLLLENDAFRSWKCSVWEASTPFAVSLERALAQDFEYLKVKSFKINGVEMIRSPWVNFPTSAHAFGVRLNFPIGKSFRLELEEPVHCAAIMFLGRVPRDA